MKNVKIQESLDAINRIKLLMDYSLEKTFSENVTFISEQSDTNYEIIGPYQKLVESEYGSDITPFDFNTVISSKNENITVLYYIINKSNTPLVIQNIKGLGDFEHKGGSRISYTKQPILKNQKGTITYTIQPRYSGQPVNTTFSSEISFISNNKTQTVKLPNVSLNLPQSLGKDNLDKHEWNSILQLGALTIPIIGPGVAMGIGFYDAYQYYKEGKKSEAMISALFSVLPMSKKLRDMFSVFSNFESNLKALGEKLVNQGINTVLTNEEKQLVRVIDANKFVINSEIKILSKSLKEKALETTKSGFNKLGKKIASGTKKLEPYFVATLLVNKLEDIEKDEQLLAEIKNKILENNKNLFTKIDSFKIINKKDNYINDVIINGKNYYFPDPKNSYKLLPKNV
jgi:hypothetical protein